MLQHIRTSTTHRLLAAFLAAAILMTLALGVLPLSLSAADDPFAQWKVDDWVRGEEEGIPMLTSRADKTIHVLYLKGIAGGNSLSYEMRIDDAYGTVDGNVGAAYKMPNGDQYFFEYNTVSKITRIRRLGADGTDNHVSPARSFEIKPGRFYSVNIHFEKNLLLWEIDGKVVGEVKNTGSDSFADGTLYVQTYNTVAAYRKLLVDSEIIETPEIQSYDFEFKTDASVKGFTATAGTVSWANDRLTYTLDGAGSRLTSPIISVASGDTYSALMPHRNTVFVRMKNETAASQVRVYYTTTTAPKYTEDKSAVFDIVPHSDDTSYFFNLSDCPTVAGGYISGFAIEPIGATNGRMTIEAVTFEREAALYDYAGTIDSCTTDGETVTVTGTLKDKYRGKTVKLYETMPENYAETLRPAEVIAEVTADGTSFTLTVPYMNGKVSRLSSLFMVGVGGVKLSHGLQPSARFSIENYADFTDNPYAFDLPDYEVKVTDAPFSAKGDAFTNDTAAIQAAIDHVSAKGGGRVVVPGDAGRYGRRYIATNIKLKDNVELHLEEGAIIWQSPRAEEYDYDVLAGHDISIPGVNWTHTASCHNLPLIQGDKVKNVKLTGKGLLRSVDTGSENIDSVSPGTIWIGCPGRLHIVPVGFYLCENVEVSGIGLRRTNNYHINFRHSRNIYVADVTMNEVTCASGDGISATVGSKNVTVDRCFFYSNDDAVTIVSSYDDPRGLSWWFAHPGEDNCPENIVVRHSNINGGHGITFITWGTDAPDLSLQEIKNISVYDNILCGGSSAVGAWPDNPYYGGTFDNAEKNDFSPVSGVRIFNNRYRGKTTLECIKATDILTDCGIRSATSFQRGNFERRDRRNSDWVSGLSNWSMPDTDKAHVSVGVDGKNHYGIIRKSGTLAQGLWMSKGEHTFTVDTRLTSGKASLVVVEVESGKLLFEKAVSPSDAFTEQTLTFVMDRGTTAYIGVRYEGDDEVWLDNASVTSAVFKPLTYFSEPFEDSDAVNLQVDGFVMTPDNDNTIVTSESGMNMLSTYEAYQEFDLHLRLRFDAVTSEIDGNFGISFFRADSANQYNVNYNPLHHFFMARSFTGGTEKIIEQKNGFDLPAGEWVDIAMRVQDGTCLIYLNGEPLMSFTVENRAAAPICIIGYNITCAIDDVILAPAGTTRITGDEIIETETDVPEESAPETNEPDTETGDVGESDTTPAESHPTDTAATPDSLPADSASGSAPAETKPAAGKKGGCQSVLGLASVSLLAAAAAVALCCRRRD